MANKLDNYVAIITGAGTGIGKAIAIGYAREGAHVVGAARRTEKLRDTAQEVEALGRKFIDIECDVQKEDDCTKVVRETIAEFGKVDVLVNNASIYPIRQFLEITSQEWDDVLATNLRGVAQMCRAVLPQMIKQKKGNIIMVNSAEARTAAVMHNHYSASKGALITLNRSLASEFGRNGIRVNGFCPGVTPETEQLKLFADAIPRGFIEAVTKATPLRRLATPEDYQGIAIFLASDDSAFMTGQTISVDGGFTMP